MLRTLRVFALLLLPVPVVFALLVLAPHLVPMNDATRDALEIPRILVSAYGGGFFIAGCAVLGQEANRRGGRPGLRLRLLVGMPLVLCFMTYWLNTFLFISRPAAPEGLALAPALGMAALTLVPPLALLAYAAYAGRHPALVQPAGG